MIKLLIEEAVMSVFNKLAAPFAVEIRALRSENEALRGRIAKLEERPDPFDVRKYIDERMEELRIKAEAPSADDVAEAISDRALARALERIDFQSEIGDKAVDWMCDQDWSSEANEAIKEWAIEEGLEDKIIESIKSRIKVTFDD